MLERNYPEDATKLLASIGVHQLDYGLWSFTDVDTASRAYIHHSTWPTALCAYASVDPVFARGRFPGRTLVDLIHKLGSLDGAETTALAQVCGAPNPTFARPERQHAFGRVVWENVRRYGLEECFERVEPRGVYQGEHHALRPRGFDWALPDRAPVPSALKAIRKTYKGLEPARQVMALSILHLYLGHPDKAILIGGCPTKILAADAVNILRNQGAAIEDWGHMVSHYPGW
jgi:hypothetical protein